MTLPDCITELQRGRFVIIKDHPKREDEADLMLAAEFITEEKINFMRKNCSGIICVPLTKKRAEELALPYMVIHNEDRFQTPFTVTVDSKKVQGGGVSDVDRSITIKTLCYGRATELSRPGHVFPLIARNGGLKERQGHTEATIALLQLAGLTPVGVICELVNPDGSMMRGKELLDFSSQNGIPLITIEEIRGSLAYDNI